MRFKASDYIEAWKKAERTTMPNIEGVGPDEPKIVHENGAGESLSPYRFDLLPAMALADVAKVMAAGAEKYGVDNWKALPPESHLNHAMQHIFAYIAGDTQEGNVIEHARHAATRILFWLDVLEGTERHAEPADAVHRDERAMLEWGVQTGIDQYLAGTLQWNELIRDLSLILGRKIAHEEEIAKGRSTRLR